MDIFTIGLISYLWRGKNYNMKVNIKLSVILLGSAFAFLCY